MASGSGGQGAGKKSVLFVCLGNICRSPMAEAVFLDVLKSKGKLNEWDVDSCATGGWHVGGEPEHRCLSVLRLNGVRDYAHTVRQINVPDDFQRFQFIFGMDNENIKNLKSMAPKDFKGKLELLGSYDPKNTSKQIRDPYYDSDDKGFKTCYSQCRAAINHFLEQEGV